MGSPFEYDLKYVVDALGINYVTGRDGKYYIPCGDCPRCASCNKKPTRTKLNLDFSKNAWNCPVQPDVGGGVLHLYCLFRGGDTKEAKAELDKLYKGETVEVKKAVQHYKKVSEESRAKETALAPLETRNNAYLELLSKLSLTDKHLKDLTDRGLTEEIISVLGYKSTTRTEVSMSADCKGVPGFNLDKGRWVFERKRSGILIPVRNLYGMICGFQIRQDRLPFDTDDTYAKYVWLQSSNKKGGCSASGTENIHFAGFFQGADIKRVCLTEGVLKADVASFISGMPFIGLTGVANTGQLEAALELLKSAGTQVVYAFPDMDRFDKPPVLAATEKWMSMIRKAGLTYDPYKGCEILQPMEWERFMGDEDLKGVDDLLWYKRRNGLI